ncbi:hypothetical protein A4H97_21655 [Niastella yeongjuensis]|uniref:Lipocalin-like domain-containing protein n=1 Tax=Niastella yeongjuensis TaxID=354355 RepID=A0A1V9F894_9BACT|nr:hypothetical protein [Niastella yeongjuensis]OQP54578.1 hypothetical protein A4H97_21655 [Niastella yeongjuensis]SEN99506.1 hypothetical protein SAMN05660816_01844 [Niastella yeongjuensis]
MNKVMILALVPLLLSVKYTTAQSSFPKWLVGSWISAEYKEALASDQGAKRGALVSPQFLYFDSLGTCSIQTRMEHKMSAGKPVSQRKFGNSFQFSYTVNKSILNVNQVEFDNDLLYITFSGVPVSTLFKRYKPN